MMMMLMRMRIKMMNANKKKMTMMHISCITTLDMIDVAIVVAAI